MKAVKVAVFLACLAPLALLVRRGFQADLGANPVETITHATGIWALRFLLLTLAISPARKLLRRPELIRFRRMLGLFAFFYACLHFLIWFVLDKTVSLPEMLADVAKRPFITAGAASLAMMLPLAVTSTAGWIRRLGGKRWQRLHRLVYVAALAAVVHFYWLVKSDIREPAMYAALLGLVLLARVPAAAR
jgi:sulfoxide reductase heme-binding subunit YedZ